MKTTKLLHHVFGAMLLLFLFTNSILGQAQTNFKLTIKIDYGTGRAGRDTVITSDRPLTALEALQYAAKVGTHPVGHYVFITSIDDVKGQRGIMAWYYEVNNQPSKTLAINNTLKNGDIVRWIYTKDVCSGKVDNCKNAGK
jgi:hypothetical protein